MGSIDEFEDLAWEISESCAFYGVLFELPSEELSQLAILSEPDLSLEDLVRSSAILWVGCFRPVFQDELQCRKMFIYEAVRLSSDRECGDVGSRRLASAFASHLADLVETRVREIDLGARK